MRVHGAASWRRASAIEDSVRTARELGNITGVGNWLRALGSISLARRDYVEAPPPLEESLTLGRKLRQPWCVSHSLSNLALVAQELDEPDTARRLLAEASRSSGRRAERLGLAANLEVYARLADGEGCAARAATLYGCAAALRESVGFDPCELGWPKRSRSSRAPLHTRLEGFSAAQDGTHDDVGRVARLRGGTVRLSWSTPTASAT